MLAILAFFLGTLIDTNIHHVTHNAIACDLKVLLSQWCLMKVTVQVARSPDRERFINTVTASGYSIEACGLLHPLIKNK